MALKCRKCGANLEMEMSCCPYCGTENPFAKQHREDMKRFTNDYKKTKAEVIDNSRRFNRRTFRITWIAVTAAAFILVIFLSAFNDKLVYLKDARKETKNTKLYAEDALEYIRNDDYIGFYMFLGNKNISIYDTDVFDDYGDVRSASLHYYEIYCSVLKAAMPGYIYKKSDAENLAYDITLAYRARDDAYDTKNSGFVCDEAKNYLDHLVRDMELMLKEYLGLSDEAVETLRNSTEAQRNVMLEEVLYAIYEEQ